MTEEALSAARAEPRAEGEPADDAAAGCFHCGSPIPPNVHLFVEYQGRMRPMCCHGCQAVAQTIVDGGFDAYYAKREAAALQSAQNEARSAEDLADYDDPEFQRNLVRELPGGVREVMLSIEGIRCAACVWLNEQAVQRLPGIVEFHINLNTAKINTLGDRAEDVFLVSGEALASPKTVLQLEQDLLAELSLPAAAPLPETVLR